MLCGKSGYVHVWLPRLRIALVSPGNLPLAPVRLKQGRSESGSENSRQGDPESFPSGHNKARPRRFSGYSQGRQALGESHTRLPSRYQWVRSVSGFLLGKKRVCTCVKHQFSATGVFPSCSGLGTRLTAIPPAPFDETRADCGAGAPPPDPPPPHSLPDPSLIKHNHH
jgi:hypothetical protein